RSYAAPCESFSTSAGATLPFDNEPSDAVTCISSRFTSALQTTKTISSAMAGGLTDDERGSTPRATNLSSESTTAHVPSPAAQPACDRSGPRQQHGAVRIARRRGDQHDLGVRHLARRRAAELAHRLVPVVEAVDERFGELATVRVDREAPGRPAERATLD